MKTQLYHTNFVVDKGQTYFEESHVSLSGCYDISELFERYFSGLPIVNFGDGIDEPLDGVPLDYDTDLLDMPTRYEFEDYRDYHSELQRALSDDAQPPKSAERPTEAHGDSHPEGQAEV